MGIRDRIRRGQSLWPVLALQLALGLTLATPPAHGEEPAGRQRGAEVTSKTDQSDRQAREDAAAKPREAAKVKPKRMPPPVHKVSADAPARFPSDI